MYFFGHAQPALLYLVPACLSGSLLVGYLRGELNTVLFVFNEEAEQSKPDSSDSQEDKKSQ